ncbi:MAG TPA: AbrB/MazE/SpoVT family DNA-binding domain-containing protein [Candidatus Babeliales bacterium]|nr:AbrB/MazE/SpoVT family DNA-binding domain-containing protein [Candidatus Babeliales bacterium]
MFKKLVKYGNSNALILDRAILELLNISEGAVVKLHTDGKSLIITPQESAPVKEIWMEGMERQKQVGQLKAADPVKDQQKEECMPGTEKGKQLAEQCKMIMDKYQDDLALLTTESFLHEVDRLEEKYHNDKTSPAFVKEYFALRLKHAPNLAHFDKEMQEVQTMIMQEDPVKYEKMKEWGPGSAKGKKLQDALKTIMEKYKDDLAILQSEAFLQAIDALTEKHKGNQSSPEFDKEMRTLRLEYAPNLEKMDKEVQKAQKALDMPDSFE